MTDRQIEWLLAAMVTAIVGLVVGVVLYANTAHAQRTQLGPESATEWYPDTSATKRKPVFDVTHPDWGADPDGTTDQDDSGAFRAILDAVNPTSLLGQHVTIFVPPGFYEMTLDSDSNAFVIDDDNVHLECAEGVAFSLADNQTESSMPGSSGFIQITGDNVKVTGCNFSGNKANNSSNDSDWSLINVAGGADNVRIREVRFSDFASKSIIVEGSSTRVRIEDSYFDNQFEGIFVGGGSSDVVVENNRLTDIAQDAIEVTSADSFVVRGNIADSISHSLVDATDFFSPGPDRGIVEGNYVWNVGTDQSPGSGNGAAFRLKSADSVTVKNNTSFGGTFGLNCAGSNVGVKFFNNRVVQARGAGVRIDSDCNLSRNIIETSSDTGIIVESGVTNARLVGNILRDNNQDGNSSTPEIALLGSSAVVAHNTFDKNTTGNLFSGESDDQLSGNIPNDGVPEYDQLEVAETAYADTGAMNYLLARNGDTPAFEINDDGSIRLIAGDGEPTNTQTPDFKGQDIVFQINPTRKDSFQVESANNDDYFVIDPNHLNSGETIVFVQGNQRANKANVDYFSVREATLVITPDTVPTRPTDLGTTEGLCAFHPGTDTDASTPGTGEIRVECQVNHQDQKARLLLDQVELASVASADSESMRAGDYDSDLDQQVESSDTAADLAAAGETKEGKTDFASAVGGAGSRQAKDSDQWDGQEYSDIDSDTNGEADDAENVTGTYKGNDLDSNGDGTVDRSDASDTTDQVEATGGESRLATPEDLTTTTPTAGGSDTNVIRVHDGSGTKRPGPYWWDPSIGTSGAWRHTSDTDGVTGNADIIEP